MIRFARKKTCKECIILFFCFLIVCSLVHWQVLCFGADGHIEIESAFHDRCDNPDHSFAPVQIVLSTETNSEVCKHCVPCIDIPISNELVQISKTTQKLNTIFPIQAINILTYIDKINSSAFNFTKNILFNTSYFDPLRTVILLA